SLYLVKSANRVLETIEDQTEITISKSVEPYKTLVQQSTTNYNDTNDEATKILATNDEAIKSHLAATAPAT
ncbi:11811_t:CDS:2, partial [Dentiscutata erythropus]